MRYWVFKVSEQDQYPDQHGVKYVYDNLHSRNVGPGDSFAYLHVNKKRGVYQIVGAGSVGQVQSRPASDSEKRLPGVTEIFTAHLRGVCSFESPVDLSSRTRKGIQNRSRIGINDFNLAGWSGSIIAIGSDLYGRIIDLAGFVREVPVGTAQPSNSNKSDYFVESRDPITWIVEDTWSLTKRRLRTDHFVDAVLKRHDFRCASCGTSVRELIVAAHIRGWAQDKNNRANPANGIALCHFCHVAFDACLIAILPTGELLVSQACNGDSVAEAHFSRVAAEIRRNWLAGIDPMFLNERVAAFESAESHVRHDKKRSDQA